MKNLNRASVVGGILFGLVITVASGAYAQGAGGNQKPSGVTTLTYDYDFGGLSSLRTYVTSLIAQIEQSKTKIAQLEAALFRAVLDDPGHRAWLRALGDEDRHRRPSRHGHGALSAKTGGADPRPSAVNREHTAMKVMVIVKATKNSEAGVMPSEQLLTEMGKYNEELVRAGIMLAGDGLHPSVKGKRIKFSGSKRSVVDGPFDLVAPQPQLDALVADTIDDLRRRYQRPELEIHPEAMEWMRRWPAVSSTGS